MKTCSKCHARKERVEFAKNSTTKDRHLPVCKSCSCDRYNAYYRFTRYKITSDQYQQMLLYQVNKCGICVSAFDKTPCIDHCHDSGEVRGLLCSNCNSALGLMKEDPDVIENAIGYTVGDKRRWVSQLSGVSLLRGKRATHGNIYRLSKYGLSREQYRRMLQHQQGRCHICINEFDNIPCIDHCHVSGNVRGLLCNPCNTAIGLMKDDPDIMASAISYLGGFNYRGLSEITTYRRMPMTAVQCKRSGDVRRTGGRIPD